MGQTLSKRVSEVVRELVDAHDYSFMQLQDFARGRAYSSIPKSTWQRIYQAQTAISVDRLPDLGGPFGLSPTELISRAESLPAARKSTGRKLDSSDSDVVRPIGRDQERLVRTAQMLAGALSDDDAKLVTTLIESLAAHQGERTKQES